MNWLVTGGCGFIGLRLVSHLIQDPNSNIRILDNLSVGARTDLAKICDFAENTPLEVSVTSNPGPVVQLVVGDILDEQVVAEVMQGVDTVVHLAANTGVGPSVEDPRSDCLTNVLGTFNILEASRLAQVKIGLCFQWCSSWGGQP